MTGQNTRRRKFGRKLAVVLGSSLAFLAMCFAVFGFNTTALLAFGVFGGFILAAISMVYYITKLLIRPVSGKVSSYLLVNEKKSMSRLSLSDAESAALNSAKNEDELLDVLKTFALEQSWVPRNVKDLPVWLLTGHIVQDANPNRWPLVS